MKFSLYFSLLLLVIFISCDEEELNIENVKIELNQLEYDSQEGPFPFSWTTNEKVFDYFIVRRTIIKDGKFYSTNLSQIDGGKGGSFTDLGAPITKSVYYEIMGVIETGNSESAIYVLSNRIKFNRSLEFLNFDPDDIFLNHPTNELFFLDKITGIHRRYKLNTKVWDEGYWGSSFGFAALFEDQLFVPRSDGRLDIYDANTLGNNNLNTVSQYSLRSVAIKNNLIFLSTGSGNVPIIVLDRNSKNIVSVLTATGEYDGVLGISNTLDYELFSVTQSGVNYYKFTPEGQLITRIHRASSDHNSLTNFRYAMLPDSPGFISTPYGREYRINGSALVTSSLPRGETLYSDIFFKSTDNGYEIYAGSSNKRVVDVYNIERIKYKTIETKGFPVKIFDWNDGLIVVSRVTGDEEWPFGKIAHEFIIERIIF